MLRNLALTASVAAGIAMSLAATTPASATITLVSPITCDIYDLAAGGCRFDISPASEAQNILGILNVYNTAIDPDLPTDAVFLGKAQGGQIFDENEQSIPGETFVNNGASWVFSDLPFDVNFFVVKASESVILFGLNPGSDSFTATNTLILNTNQVAQGISHVNFYSATFAVPEPATWALMILGFGAVGYAIRRRRFAAA